MDYSKWKKIVFIIFIIGLIINAFSKVFASDNSFELLSPVTTKPLLSVLLSIDTVTLDNNSVPSNFFNYENCAFFNRVINGTYYLNCVAWNGDLKIYYANNGYQIRSSSLYYYGLGYGNSRGLWASNIASISSNNNWNTISSGSETSGFSYWDVQYCIFSSANIYDSNNNVIYESDVDNTIYPNFDTPYSEINSLSFDKLRVSLGDFSVDTPLYLHVLQIWNKVENTGDDTIYYYTDNEFRLDSDSPYLIQYLDSDIWYYAIPRYKMGFSTDSVYLLVLSDNGDTISNSVGEIVKDDSSGIFEAVSVNTENIYTYQEMIDDNMQNINDELSNTDTDLSDEDIEDVFEYDNHNSQLTNNHEGFFTRLLSLFSNLTDYNLGDDTTIEIPLPNSSKKITLHSNIIYQNIGEPLKSIIGAFWVYIFYMYAWKFFNYIFIEIETGKILDDKDESSVPGAIHTDIL